MYSFKDFLTEEVYGNLATVYHRTNKPHEISSMGYKYGPGSAYGDGIYCCFDIYSQFDENMEIYGKYLIKIKVNLSNYLIFDKDIQIKTFGQTKTLLQQINEKINVEKSRILTKPEQQELISWAKQNAPEEKINSFHIDAIFFDQSNPKISKFIYNKHEDYLNSLQYKVSSADIETIKKFDKILDKGALSSIVAFRLPDYIRREFEGIMFTGKNDGRVCVIYSFGSAKLLSYTFAPIDEKYSQFTHYLTNKVDKLQWIPFVNKDIKHH